MRDTKDLPNEHRIKSLDFFSDESYGNNGAFILSYRNYDFKVIISDDMGWEHVSVSLKNRCPNWPEMCYFKKMFFKDEECVVQFHPPESEYVNDNNHCLHMWRSINKKFPMPEKIMV